MLPDKKKVLAKCAIFGAGGEDCRIKMEFKFGETGSVRCRDSDHSG